MLSIFVPGRYLISTCLDPPLTYENTPRAASSTSRSDPISVMTDPAPPSPREPESASAKTFARVSNVSYMCCLSLPVPKQDGEAGARPEG